jgi:cytochrome c553
MNAMMKGASDNDVRTMAAFLAKLPPPQPVAGPTDPARMEAAHILAQSHRCNFCHAGNYAGQENVPRLAGQREDYLIKTLREYKSDTRRGYDAAMADVIQPISDEQILDLSYFLARVP